MLQMGMLSSMCLLCYVGGKWAMTTLFHGQQRLLHPLLLAPNQLALLVCLESQQTLGLCHEDLQTCRIQKEL